MVSDISELEEALAELLPEQFKIKFVKGQCIIETGLKKNHLTDELEPIDDKEEEEDEDLSEDLEDDDEVPDAAGIF